jgi:sphinganine-1-phosphate aldolase
LPPLDDDSGPLTAEEALELLQGLGIGGGAGADPGGAALPEQMAPLLALIEALPSPVTEQLLVELLARLVEPGGDGQASVRGGA